MYQKCFKRALDLLLSAIGIIVLSPLLVVLWIVVLCDVGFPAIFKQERIGYKERTFRILKFRTMTNDRDIEGELLPDSKRVTKIGSFLRHSSLDELPQLLNILMGDMSIVGPRPLPPSYLPYYYPEETLRHSVRPGMTGLAQVKGRTNLTWNRKLELDIQYVNNLSFGLDCRIVLQTISKVLRKSDVRDSAIEGPLSECRKKQGVAYREAEQSDNATH